MTVSLQMILGPSGTGKSTYAYDLITKEAAIHTDKRYFVIVPDQFTMQTQADMVAKSRPKGGIMNIDVLSFSRLAHRIFEETNVAKKLVLDDTGKSLVLRKIAADIEEEIPYLRANMRKEGYIHEVKSAISEFMQYDLAPEDVSELAGISAQKGALPAKLKDLKVIYEHFLQYIKESYITSEELMDVLARELDKSKLIKGSVVCLDGFTGFTPVQMKVLGRLFNLCDEVYITLTLEKGKENCGAKEQDLFSFTAKSYETVLHKAYECKTEIKPLIYCEKNYRFEGKPELEFLERNIFRYPQKTYEGECDRIHMSGAANIQDEVKNIAASIRKLLQSGAQYRDIAVVIGNMPDYEYQIELIFGRMNIPVYMDKTKAFVMNPVVEYTKSVLQVIKNDYDRESVLRLCRCGVGGFSDTDVDIFENVILKSGVRGYKRYSEPWKCMKNKTEEDENVTDVVNTVRERILFTTKSFHESGIYGNKKARVTEFVMALYNSFVQCDLYEEIEKYRAFFEKESDFVREKEYAQVYRLTMELLEQINSLLGEEIIDMEDFIQLVEAGFDEITVGTIPQSVDRVIVGDIERSRLKPVKYLFFAGVNDGAIPKTGGSCNILSDMEREFLASAGANLSPTPAQKMYIQRFYLYTNLVKPTEELYLSYSLMDNEGKASRPAYLVGTLKRMFPSMTVQNSSANNRLENILCIDDLKKLISSLLRKYSMSDISEDETEILLSAIDLLREQEKGNMEELLMLMIQNSFFRNTNEKLDAKIAGVLYGEIMSASISRMEQYANCAYAYFLQYGLSLKDREEYGIDNRQLGTIFHGVLEEYGSEIKKRGIAWTDLDPEVSDRLLEESLERWTKDNGSYLFDSKAGEYIYSKMKKVIKKAVNTLGYHLKAGEFDINGLEVEVNKTISLDEINAAFDVQEKMNVKGRIDRIDTCEKDDKVYVKIIDYKMGNKDFSLINLYYGLNLQLVLYMQKGMEHVSHISKGKDVVPAALLYYRVADDAVDGEKANSEEDINNLILDSLRTKGLVNDDIEVVKALDRDIVGKSNVIPVQLKNDGGYHSQSKIMSEQDLRLLGEYTMYKLRNMGNEIITGNIAKNPIEIDSKTDSCSYCAFKESCGFDTGLDGYEMRKLEKIKDEEILEMMRTDIEEE